MTENLPSSSIGSLEPFDPEADNCPAYVHWELKAAFMLTTYVANERK